jgi:hypothetical protein
MANSSRWQQPNVLWRSCNVPDVSVAAEAEFGFSRQILIKATSINLKKIRSVRAG